VFFDAKIDFLIRAPVNRVVCKEFVSESVDIESSKYAVRYGKRGLLKRRR
jgi:hypothetical protein